MLRIFILAALFAGPAFAAQQCGPRDRVLAALVSKYGESRRVIGMSASNTVMEVFASDETGTWTITVTDASGKTCLAASGDGFEAVREGVPPKGTEG